MQEIIQSFADFATDDLPLGGKKKKIEEVLNKQIAVTGYKIMESKHKQDSQCLQLQFDLDGERFILFTGSSVLAKQCEKYADKIPFHATIIKIDKFFTFS